MSEIVDTYRVIIPLPFYLPVKNGLSLLSVYHSNHFKVRFAESMRSEAIEGFLPRFNRISVLDVSLGVTKPIPSGVDVQDVYRYAMAAIVGHINRIVDAFGQQIAYANMRHVSVTDLPFVIDFWHNDSVIPYVTNPHFVLDDMMPDVDKSVLAEVANRMDLWDNHDWIGIPDRFYDRAIRSLWREDFAIAVIELQTSFEVYIDNSLRLVWTKSGLPINEISDRLERTAFRNKIEQHLASRISHRLSFSDGFPDQLRDWKTGLYDARNRIVHEGQTYLSREEAFSALDAYILFRNWIADRLVETGDLSERGTVNRSIFGRKIDSPEFDAHMAAILAKYGLKESDTAEDT